MGALEAAAVTALGSGEGPSLVPEELALDERLGDRAEVDGHERSVGPRGSEVDRPGHELLPGARLALHQGRHVAHRDRRHRLVDPVHRGALPHEPAARRAVVHELAERAVRVLEPRVLAPQADPLDRVLEHPPHEIEVHGLEDEVAGAGPHRLDRGLEGCLAREDERLDVGLVGLQSSEELEPVDPGHVDVGQGRCRTANARGPRARPRRPGRCRTRRTGPAASGRAAPAAPRRHRRRESGSLRLAPPRLPSRRGPIHTTDAPISQECPTPGRAPGPGAGVWSCSTRPASGGPSARRTHDRPLPSSSPGSC